VQGQAVAEVYAPAKQGAATVRAVCDALETSMAAGIRIASPDIRFEGVVLGQFQDSGGWTRRDVTVRFTYFEVR
jgi:hypothetical protein